MTKKTAYLTVRFPPELLDEIRTISDDEERSTAGQIVYWARLAVNEYRVRKGASLKVVSSQIPTKREKTS